MKVVLAAMALALVLSGCVGAPEPGWPDRPWIDSGCTAPGRCRVRGRLELPDLEGSTRGVLRLDDGTCLAVDLTGGFVRTGRGWDGRRVAVRGMAVPAADLRAPAPASCPSELVLYVERLSLKANR
ncbi:hypothetical protein [Brevundimonas sp.]|uniref:hypothetical protein n=1 Tax=Brevundimonas sp. TaxID=1871086 RepID=UPI002FCB6BF3